MIFKTMPTHSHLHPGKPMCYRQEKSVFRKGNPLSRHGMTQKRELENRLHDNANT